MKGFIFFPIFSLCIAISSFSQPLSGGNFQKQALPAGYGHQQTGVKDWENHILIMQAGFANFVDLSQEGKNNGTGIIQSGDLNLYSGRLKGGENIINVLQSGRENIIYQEISGRGRDMQVIQQGYGHELIQIEHGGYGPTPHVHQRGQGMKVIIETR